MLKILLVEDDALFAETLKHLVELNPRYSVRAIAADFSGAIKAAEEHRPDLALVDLQLTGGSTGFSVAAKLAELEIPCLFTTGNAPAMATPDLAIGCLAKPFSEEDLVRALKAAEDVLRGRERLRRSRPHNLRMYSEEEQVREASQNIVTRRRTRRWWRSALTGVGSLRRALSAG